MSLTYMIQQHAKYNHGGATIICVKYNMLCIIITLLSRVDMEALQFVIALQLALLLLFFLEDRGIWS